MIYFKNSILRKLNHICELKEEFTILWRSLSSQTKQNKNLQSSLIKLLIETDRIKNTLIKEIENEQPK